MSSARPAFSRKRAPNSALPPSSPTTRVLELVGLDQHEVRARRLVGVGEVDDDPVVGPDRVGLQAELVADARAERQAPRGVDAPAVGREHAQPPVADLVAEALDDDRAVARHDARGLLLLAQEVEEVARGERVEVVVALEHLGGLVDGPARRTRRSPRPAPSAGRRRRRARTARRPARRAPA